jgi:hypothetical protein
LPSIAASAVHDIERCTVRRGKLDSRSLGTRPAELQPLAADQAELVICDQTIDMTFDEDDCRIRKGDGAQNFAILRRIALNLVKQEKSDKKTSVHIKRLKAGWSTDYLQTLLGLQPL